MKITSYSDEKLTKLYNKYSYDNIFKYFDGFDRPYYFIPPELVINTYEGSSIEIYDESCLDLDPNWDNYVGCNSIERILNKCCNLTSQEYFDILVLHINDTEDRPKCKYCGIPLTWSGRILSGYGSRGHRWNESENHFCTPEHIVIYRNSHLEEYPDYKEFIYNGGSFGIQYQHPEIYGDVGLRDYRIHIETMRNKFKNQGNPTDECYFYITKTSKLFKFGITSDIDSRTVFGSSFSDYKSDLRIILKGTRDYIADLEAEIKLKLGSSEEFISWERVPKFIQYFGKTLLELNK